MHPDAPGHQVGAPGHPPRPVLPADPDVLVQGRGVGAGDVPGAVLEAHHVAGGLCAGRRRGRLAEAQLRPADRGAAHADPGQVADGVHRHLRVVRAGLDAQVAAAAGRVQVVAGEPGQIDERVGPLVLQAEPPLGEQRGTEADRQRQPGRFETQRLARVVRRGLGQAAVRPVADRVTGRHPLGGPGPLLEQRDEFGPVLRGHVERGEVQPVLDGGGDSGLVRTVERHRRATVRGRDLCVVGTDRGDGTSGRHRAQCESGAAPAEQRPPGGCAAGALRRRGPGIRALGVGGRVLRLLGHARIPSPTRYLVTAAASRDSGSASALTASDSSLRSALPTFSYEVNS